MKIIILMSLFLNTYSFARSFEGMTLDNEGLNISFSEPIKADILDIKRFDRYIQVNLLDTKVVTEDPFLDIPDSSFKRVAVFQSPNSVGSIRLFLADSQSAESTHFNYEINDKQIRIVLPIPESNILKQPEIGSARMDLTRNMQTVGLFSLVFILFGILSLVLKKYIIKKRLHDQSSLRIQTLASKILGPRQKIELLEIDGFRILVGVSPENISMLGRFERKFDVRQLASASRSTNSQPDQSKKTNQSAKAVESVKSLMRRRISELPNP